MNHIYKVVWNKARSCYMAVSEIAKGHQKGSSRTKGALKTAVLGALTAVMLTTGGVAGTVWAANPVPDTLTIPENNTVTSTDKSKSTAKDLNANITGKDNNVTNSKDVEIVGDKNTVTDVYYNDDGKTVNGNVPSNNVRVVGSNNSISGSRNQHVIGDNNTIIGRDDGTVTDYSHPDGRESYASDLTIGRDNFIRGDDTYRNEWDSLTVIGNHNRADYSTESAGGPAAGIVIGDNQNIDYIKDSIVIGSLSPAEREETVVNNQGDTGEKYLVGENSIILGYHTSNPTGNSVVIGNHSQANNFFQTMVGHDSVAEGSNGPGSINGVFASSYGNLNKIHNTAKSLFEYSEDDIQTAKIDGFGNNISGNLNTTSNATGTMVMGQGNTVSNSQNNLIASVGGEDTALGLKWAIYAEMAAGYYDNGATYLPASTFYDMAQSTMQNYMKYSSGAVSIFGNGNAADYAIRSQILGTGNSLTGEEKDISANNTISGFANSGTNVKRTAIVGTGNTLNNGEDNVVIGDYHQLEGGKHNVILGSMATEEKEVTRKAKYSADDSIDTVIEYTTKEQVPVKANTSNIENAVMLGYNTDVTQSGGVAVGSDSVASTAKGVTGLDLKGEDHSSDTTGTWKSTAAAVSVGDSTGNTKTTRQITNLAAGTNDTDAVNVAQLKQVSDMINNNTNTSKVHYYSVKSKYTAAGSNYDNDGAKGQESMVLGIASSSDAAYSTVIGMGNTASKRSSSIGSGMYDTVVGQYLHTTGSFNNVFGTYYYGLEGNKHVQVLTEVYGDRNTVMGVGNQVGNKNNKSDENTVIGMKNQVEGSGSIIVGNATTVDGQDSMNATSIGHVNHIYNKQEGGGQWGVALGNRLTVKGEHALAVGNDNTAQGEDAVAIGHSTSTSGQYALAMGSSSTASSKSTAIGYKATAQNDAVAIGDSAKAGNNGIAVGMHANAGYGQNMALGYYASVANGVKNSTALGYGSQVTQRDILASDGSDGVISVGKAVGQSGEKGLTRRIINVKAGVKDTDAVNVSQLKTAASEVKGGTNIASVTTDKAADGHTIYTVNAKGTEVTGDSNFTVTPSTDEKTNITTYGLALNDTITIGKGKDAKPITIDGTKGEITGLTNRDTKAADFAKAGRAATEEQLDAMHNTISNEDRYVQSGTIDTTSGTMKLTVANGKTVDITGLTDYQLDTDSAKTKYDATAHKLTLSMKDTLNTGNPAKSVEFDGIANTADVAKAKTEIRGGTNIASLGTETAADGHTIYTVNAKGAEVKGDSNFTVTPSTDEKTNITTYNLALNNTITIGKGKDAKPITIDGTKGEISGLTNTTWDKDRDYSKSTKAATEAQIQSAVNAAKEEVKASDVDTHVKAGSYGVDANHQVSMNIVDKNGNDVKDEKGNAVKVTITDVAKASEVGKLSDLDKSITNKSTVVDAINSVNTKVDNVDKKVGDLDYSSTNYVAKNDSATTAIGKLDAAIKDASSVANNITGGSNIDVSEVKDDKGHVTGHKVALKDDISLNSVTAKTVKADDVNTKNLSVSDSATIGKVSINKDGKGTVNGLTNTTWDADKITSGQAATEDQLKAATKNAVNYDGDDSKTITLRKDTTIKNVADTSIEKGSTSAVNAGTVYNETRVANDGHYIKAANTAGANITALDNQVAANAGNIFNLDNRVGELGSRINKVGAGAAALAALHPLDFDPSDKWDFAAGVGNYRNETAAAVGLFYRPNARSMFNLGWTMGDNRNMVNGGFSIKLGKGSAYNDMSKAQMAETISGQATKIDRLESTVDQQDKKIAKLEEMLKKQGEMIEKLAEKK